MAVNANLAQKVRASPVPRATALLHHAEMDHRARPALKAKAMVAVKVVVTVNVTVVELSLIHI